MTKEHNLALYVEQRLLSSLRYPTSEKQEVSSVRPDYFTSRHMEQARHDIAKFHLLSLMHINRNTKHYKLFYLLLTRNMMTKTYETLLSHDRMDITSFKLKRWETHDMYFNAKDVKENIETIQFLLSSLHIDSTDRTIPRIVGAVEDLTQFGLVTHTYKYFGAYMRLPIQDWVTRLQVNKTQLSSWTARWQMQK